MQELITNLEMKIFILVFLLTFYQASLAALIPAIDPNEEFPGGTGTTSDFSVQAFSHPMSGTRNELRREFNVGNSFFNTVWVSSPSSTTLRDGLGPIYNAVSCSSCHFKDGRGRGLPELTEVSSAPVDVSLLFRLRVKKNIPVASSHPVYGGQFQPQSVMGIQGEGRAMVQFEKIQIEYQDGSISKLLKPIYEFIKLNFGDLGNQVIVSPRVAPQMVGLGLVEAIPEAQILQNEDPLDLDGDGVSGRANRVFSVEHQEIRLGRFGWKAGKPSLLEQNAAAFNGDIGITSPLFPNIDCTESQPDCNHAQGNEVDISIERLNQVTSYTQLLAVPMRRDFNKEEVVNGRAHFYQLNCVSCHTPSFTTDTNSKHQILNGQKIFPYSDFLLHDMGDDLADDKEEYFNEEQATSREWRTPPLWGSGLVPVVNGHTRYLHDGRARNLEEAILWHGGEAQKSKKPSSSFQKLRVMNSSLS